VINVGLCVGPLSVKSKDPGSLGKDRLFYWKKTLRNCHAQNREDSVGVVQLLSSSQNLTRTFFAARLRHFPASA